MADRSASLELRSGLVAEFGSEDAIVRAARAVYGAGHTDLDALTPRPVEPLLELIAPERSTLPRSVFIGGAIGAAIGLLVQWYCNAWDYPLNVGGRPPFSLPAFVPITFEIMVLFAALTTFFGVLFRMRLPRLAHPVFAVPGIESASIDSFWLVIPIGVDRPEAEALQQRLEELGALQVASVPARKLPPAAARGLEPNEVAP